MNSLKLLLTSSLMVVALPLLAQAQPGHHYSIHSGPTTERPSDCTADAKFVCGNNLIGEQVRTYKLYDGGTGADPFVNDGSAPIMKIYEPAVVPFSGGHG